MFRASVLVLLGGVTGCLWPSEPAPTSESTQAAATPCGYGCGDNGGLVNGTPFWGLYLTGAENDEHVRYVHFARSMALMEAGTYAPLDVDGGRLRIGAGPGALYGSALEDGIIQIAIGSDEYYIKIAQVSSATPGGGGTLEPFWTREAAAHAETYQLQWTPIDAPLDANGTRHFEEVCAYTQLDDDLWKNQINAVVFEGEKYDINTKKISLTSIAPFAAWFNIACEGSLPAKMYLTRRTTASSVANVFKSTIDNDRQAMTRAWAAEYCGNGVSFTQTGHKLRMRDNRPFPDSDIPGWLPREAPLGFSEEDKTKSNFAYEAVWGPGGAVCLETPRMAVADPHVPRERAIEERIARECPTGRPPRCSEQSWFPDRWAEHGQLLTATLAMFVGI